MKFCFVILKKLTYQLHVGGNICYNILIQL